MDHVVHRVDSFLEYSIGFNSVLGQMFVNDGFKGSDQFLVAPVFADSPVNSGDNIDADDLK